MSSEAWLNDKYVKKWFSEGSKRTAKNSTQPFKEWLDFIEMTPTQQVEKRIKDLQSPNPQTRRFFEDKLIEWKNELVKEVDEEGKRRLTKGAIHTKLQRVMAFFNHNNVRLLFARGQLDIEPASREKVKLKWVPKNEEIRMMYRHGDARERGLLLALYHSGFSEIDVASLNIEHFPNLYDTDTHHYIAKLREKTNILQQTCLSIEAIFDIRAMLRERDNPTQGALFITPQKNRVSVRYINDTIKQLAIKTFGEEKAKAFQTKNLRDSYKNALLRAHLDREIKDKMFGHKREGAKESYQLEQALIEEAYDRTFKYLSINHGFQTRQALNQVQQTVIGLSKQIAKLNEIVELLYPKESKRFIQFKDKTLTWEETFNTPEEFIESQREFMTMIVKANNKQYDEEFRKYLERKHALEKPQQNS